MDNILSEKEQKLYEFIKNANKNVTVKVIEEELGKEYTGAIGKLISCGKIEKTKKKSNEQSINTSPYASASTVKYIKVYVIKEENNE